MANYSRVLHSQIGISKTRMIAGLALDSMVVGMTEKPCVSTAPYLSSIVYRLSSAIHLTEASTFLDYHALLEFPEEGRWGL